MNAPATSSPGDDDGLLCVNGLQHAFVLTAWEQAGAEVFWASELFCPTCGTSVTRTGYDGGWAWNAPDG